MMTTPSTVTTRCVIHATRPPTGGAAMRLATPGGWTMICPSGCNPRTLRNFPIQSTGAEILHVITILAERRGIEIVAPIHDAIMVQGYASDAEDLARVVDRLMRDASATVLDGRELPSDCKILMPGEHFQDKRGKAMWDTVTKLLAKVGRNIAGSPA
jgi:DNA polymerase-1